MELTDVRFIYAYPLDANRRRAFDEKEPGKYPSIETVQSQVEHWREVWDQSNQQNRVLTAITDITGSIPSRSLECFCIGGGINPMSSPLLMSMTNHDWSVRSDEEFIDTLVHELLHVFLENSHAYFQKVKDKYPTASNTTRNHIIVFVMLQKLYEKLFNRVSTDLTRVYKSEDYTKAIEIMKKEGANALLSEYRRFV